jgi:hypothetical protein
MFQSTHPCGVRRGGLLYWMTGPSFQSTHPCGVRLEQLESLRSLAEFQSTHPCGVRRCLSPSVSSWPAVSIHAPLRGATVLQPFGDIPYSSFNPRTPAGCDLCNPTIQRSDLARFNPRTPAGCDGGPWSRRAPQVSFNPRTPAGCDKNLPKNHHTSHGVSIHAPLRGAT